MNPPDPEPVDLSKLKPGPIRHESLPPALLEHVQAIIVRMGLKKLPLMPSRQTMYLMAKAAVTVYETAVENQTE